MSIGSMLSIFQQLPKAELHCHLDGSLRSSTLLELAVARGLRLAASDAESLGKWMRVDDARNLEDYLARFDITLSVMQSIPELERIAREFVVDAAADGVRYIEARFCPALCMREGLSGADVMDAVLRGLLAGELESGTVARVIVCALRSFAMPHAMEMAELAIAYRDRGVVGFDLAGGEAGNRASEHAAAFDAARRSCMAVTVHAGEGDGAASIAEAIQRCAADRIGHGTRLREDPRLERYVIDRQIPLEICPTSNVQTRVASSIGEHPLGRYVRGGALVTINTDNRLMSGVTLSEEFMICGDAFGFNGSEIVALALNGFDSAFLPWPERRILRDQAEKDALIWLDRYGSALGVPNDW